MLHKSCSWINFVFWMLLQLSATICTCHLGQISPGSAHFWPKLGVSLAENVVIDLKYHKWFPFQSYACLWTDFDFGMLQQLSAIMCICHLGQTSPESGVFFSKFKSRLGKKWCDWIQRPCTIPPPGFVDLSHESVLTLECFRNSLEPCVHAIWAKSALELLVLGQNWGSIWQKMVLLS